jgi:hypothetical protein
MWLKANLNGTVSTGMSDATPAAEHREPEPASIHLLFRNGSLTAISVLVGFSLSFLSRWAGTSGQWHVADLIAVTLIVIGIGLQIWALSSMLFISSLIAEKYMRAVRLFLAGLAVVAIGIAAAILADIAGLGPSILGG